MVCQGALETRWTGPTDVPRTDTASHKLIPALGTLTTAIAKSTIAWGCNEACLEQHDPAWMEVRRLCVERRCEKDPLKRKRLSIAFFRARQLMHRKQADLRFKKAVAVGAPSRLQGPPPPTRAPMLEKLVRTAQPKGWKTCRDAPTSSTITTRSCSRIRCTNRLQSGYGNDGHMKCCSLCRPSMIRG